MVTGAMAGTQSQTSSAVINTPYWGFTICIYNMIKYILGSACTNGIFRILRGSTYTSEDDVIDEMLDPKTWRKISEFSIKSEKGPSRDMFFLTGKYVDNTGEEKEFRLTEPDLVTKIKNVLSVKVERDIAFLDDKLEEHLRALAEILFSEVPCTGEDFVTMKGIEKIYKDEYEKYEKDTSNKYNEACYKYITGLINLIKRVDAARVKAAEEGIEKLVGSTLGKGKELSISYRDFCIVMNRLVSTKPNQLKKICSARMLKKFAEKIKSQFKKLESAEQLSKKLTEQADAIPDENDTFETALGILREEFTVSNNVEIECLDYINGNEKIMKDINSFVESSEYTPITFNI